MRRPGSRWCAVSPMNTLTALNGTSSSSATIWPIATCRPWPMSILPKIGGHAAVGIHGDVGRQLVRRQRRLGALRQRRVMPSTRRCRPACRPRRRARRRLGAQCGARSEVLSILVMVRLPHPIISAARLTARRMPIWVPQRHFRPVSASLISASVGFFFSRRNAAAVMIQPLMQ